MKKRSLYRKAVAGLAVLSICTGTLGMSVMAEEASAAEQLGVVETAYGQAQGVEGKEFKDVTLFKGVPYAAPPVEDLRWKEPQDPEGWDGVKVFDTYADGACQWPDDMDADPWKTDFYYEEMPPFSEDCLYLNIATPSVSGDEEMPVYVWFHGGGLNHGFSYEVECDPEALAAKGVVVVEVGTRLGVFGYMALPQLSEESGYGASGNYGLMDSIKAVEWVRDNIEGFGGNPDNITIGGQSGGTSKTAAFFGSEQGASLVKNVIWESGLKYTEKYSSVEAMEEKGIAWLQECGLTGEESLEELRAMDASVFMGSADTYKQAPQGMVTDGKYLEFEGVKDAFEAGRYEGVNILVGSNMGDGTDEGIDGHTMETAEEFYDYYKKLLGNLYEEYDFENLVQVTDENAFDTARFITSMGFGRSSRTLMWSVMFGPYYDKVNENGNVYAYLFSHRTPGRNEDYYWAWHSSELWYVFGSLRDIPEQREWSEWDHELADMCTSYWTNFMKNGDPNGEGLPEWAPSTADQMAYMDFAEKDTTGTVTDMGELQDLLVAYGEATYGY